jgi:hypothetical protein
MPQYNWRRVIRRVALAFALVVLAAVRAHTSWGVWPPNMCSGGLMDGVQFVVELLAAVLVVEGIHWMTWRMRQTSKALRAKQQIGVHISFPTGGKLFAPVGAIPSFFLGLFVLRISNAYIGSVTPCEAVDLRSISGKMIAAVIVGAYGLLLIADAGLRKLPRSSGS